jgi:hypothetical protein
LGLLARQAPRFLASGEVRRPAMIGQHRSYQNVLAIANEQSAGMAGVPIPKAQKLFLGMI